MPRHNTHVDRYTALGITGVVLILAIGAVTIGVCYGFARIVQVFL